MTKEAGVNEFNIGDAFQRQDKSGEWLRFWNNPLRDKEDAIMAQQIVESKGYSLGYRGVGYETEFRTVSPKHEEFLNGFLDADTIEWLTNRRMILGR